jgi:hypothetical protein
MSKVQIKLPKQWRHWCRLANLRIHDGSKWARRKHAWFYLKGRGRVWRVNCFGVLQRGDTYEDFDRWALCDIRELPMPKTQKEFLDTIARLENGEIK